MYYKCKITDFIGSVPKKVWGGYYIDYILKYFGDIGLNKNITTINLTPFLMWLLENLKLHDSHFILFLLNQASL